MVNRETDPAYGRRLAFALVEHLTSWMEWSTTDLQAMFVDWCGPRQSPSKQHRSLAVFQSCARL